jgi:hypothetical protein
MSIISGLFLKSGTPSLEGMTTTLSLIQMMSTISHTPIKDVQIYRDYPSKPACITLFSEYAILSVHANRLQ